MILFKKYVLGALLCVKHRTGGASGGLDRQGPHSPGIHIPEGGGETSSKQVKINKKILGSGKFHEESKVHCEGDGWRVLRACDRSYRRIPSRM